MYYVQSNDTDKRVINPCEERKLYKAGVIWAYLEGGKGVYPDPVGL